MMRALWTAASGMQAQQTNVDVIANNLANVNTTGFKKARAEFEDLLYSTLQAAGTEANSGVKIPTGIQIGHGARTVATGKIFTQGDFMQTDNSLDVVIEGSGFFEVLKSDGTSAYTRDGSFKVDADGKLVNANGLTLQPEITIPSNATEVTIGQDGTVSAVIAGQSTPQSLGQITLAKFINPAGLKSIGKNLYEVTESSGQATTGTPGTDGLGTILQGYVEMSNVKVVEEMVNMIVAQRAYEVNSKGIQASDDMLRLANSLHR